MKQVTAAILLRNGKCLIGKRCADDFLGGLWELPGGKIEPGETPEECLKREMKEEFSIDVEVRGHFADTIHHYADRSIKLMAYFIHWSGETLELHAHDEISWVDRQTIDAYEFAPADLPFIERLKDWLV